MRTLRWSIVLTLLAYVLQSLLAAVFSTALKFDWVSHTAHAEHFSALARSTSLLQLAAWWAAIVFYVNACWRLTRRMPAFRVYAIALVLDVGTWVTFKLGGAYDRTFSSAEQSYDYVLLAFLLFAAAPIWILESEYRA